jgi:hypothetical protein
MGARTSARVSPPDHGTRCLSMCRSGSRPPAGRERARASHNAVPSRCRRTRAACTPLYPRPRGQGRVCSGRSRTGPTRPGAARLGSARPSPALLLCERALVPHRRRRTHAAPASRKKRSPSYAFGSRAWPSGAPSETQSTRSSPARLPVCARASGGVSTWGSAIAARSVQPRAAGRAGGRWPFAPLFLVGAVRRRWAARLGTGKCSICRACARAGAPSRARAAPHAARLHHCPRPAARAPPRRPPGLLPHRTPPTP